MKPRPTVCSSGVVVSLFKKGDHRIYSHYRVLSHYSAHLGKFIPGGCNGGSGQIANLEIRKLNADPILVMELWTSTLPPCRPAVGSWEFTYSVYRTSSHGEESVLFCHNNSTRRVDNGYFLDSIQLLKQIV